MAIKQFEIPLNVGWGEKPTKQFSPSDVTNFYLDVNQGGQNAVLSTGGLVKEFDFHDDGVVRQLYMSKINENMHAVVNDKIFQIDSTGTPIFGYTINTDSSFVDIESNYDEIMFVDGIDLYLYNRNTGVYSTVTSGSKPPKPGSVSVLAGRFFVNELESDKLHISEINDGNNWTGNIIKLTSYPEIIVSHATLHGKLFLLGTRCAEVWFPTGSYPFVARDENMLIEFGCAAQGSVSVAEDRICWLGYDKQGVTSVVVTNGGYPQKISNDEIENEFQTYTNVSDCTAFMYKRNGIIFYQMNFTTDNKSFLYNFDSNTWTRLCYSDETRHLANSHAYFNNKSYFGSYNSTKIFSMENSAYTDDGVGIRRRYRTNVFYPANGNPFILHKLMIRMEQDGSTDVGNGLEPKIFFRISRDNGISFGNHISAPTGKTGQREYIVDFYQLGYFKYGTIVLDFEFYHVAPCNLFKILMYWE